MKKVLALIVSVVFALVISSCSSSEVKPEKSEKGWFSKKYTTVKCKLMKKNDECD